MDTSSEVQRCIAELGLQSYSSVDLMSFTSNFLESNRIGSGGYGEVYKGHLPKGILIAVKLLKKMDVVEDAFMIEVRTMGKACHRNLIKLYGYCFEDNIQALVYEYMENGSLDKILYENNHVNIEWVKLYAIAIDTANGLKYLHHDLEEQIIHHDIKAANVLLGKNLLAKLTDFGLAKIINRNVSCVYVSRIRGTQNYIAPEIWIPGSQVSCKCDVYSFGMMLFEILGRRSNDVEENWFPRIVWKQFKSGKLEQLIRDCGITEKDKQKAIILSKVALCCSHHRPERRPSMKEVVSMLEEHLPVEDPSYPFLPGQFYNSSIGPSQEGLPQVFLEVPLARSKRKWLDSSLEWDPADTSYASITGEIVSGGEPGKDYQGKATVYVIMACIVAAMGGLIFGYDNGISGGVTSMTLFLKKFDGQILTFFISSLYLAALLASFVASWRCGCTLTMFFGGLVFVAGSFINGFARNVAMLILGRIMLGFGVGFASQSVPLYLSEMAPYKRRGLLNQMFQLFITIGNLVANVVNYFTSKMDNGQGWRWSLGLAAVPGLSILLGGIFLPETPNSLIERNRPEDALKLLKRIRGVDNVDEEYNDLVAASEASNKITDPWHRLFFARKYRPQLTYSIALPSLQQFSGINVVMIYAPVLFMRLGFQSDASLMSALTTVGVNVLATFIALWLADKKCLFMAGGIQMFISQLAVGILIWINFKWSGEGNISGLYPGIVVFFICSFVFGFAYSWGPLAWLVISEILPREVRSAAQSVNVSLHINWTFVIGHIFLTLLCHLKFVLFFMFATCVFVISYFLDIGLSPYFLLFALFIYF